MIFASGNLWDFEMIILFFFFESLSLGRNLVTGFVRVP